MKIFRLFTALVAISIPLPAQEFTPEAGFVSLFNGKDLTGWGYKGEAPRDGQTEASDGRYSAKGGTLTVNPHAEGKGPRLRQLWTTKEFAKDFVLKLEFRATVNADSGVFLRKPQLQCRDYLVAGPYKELTRKNHASSREGRNAAIIWA